MKTISYICASNKLLIHDELFYTENNSTELVIDFTDSGCDGLRKWVDFVIADGSETTRPTLETFYVGNILTIILGAEFLKEGTLTFQPYASDPLTGKKVIFNVLSAKVDSFLNVLNDTAFIDPTPLELALSLKMNKDGSNSDIDELHFDITPSSTDALLEGQMRWNAASRTLNVGVDGNGVVLQLGEEMYYPQVRNVDTVEIEDGDTVMYAGTVGGSGIIFIKKAYTPSMPLPGMFMGIATEHIAINGSGKVTWFGLINGVQTDGSSVGQVWTDNTILYNHSTIAGKLSNTKPVAPATAVQAAIVVRAHATAGILFVRPIFFPFLNMLSDVAITTPQLGDVLKRTALNRWENTNELSLPRWDDLQFPLTQSKQGANLKPDVDYTNIGLLFPQNDTSEYVIMLIQLPHVWKVGTEIHPHIHYTQSQAVQPVFRLEYKWTNIGDVESGTWSTLDLNLNALPYTSGNMHQILKTLTPILGTGKTISSILAVKLYRTDNVYIGDLLAKQFDIHIQIDSFGSQDEYIKT